MPIKSNKEELLINKLTTFISKSNETHSYKYDYTKSIYKNNNTNLIIICQIHGEFNQTPKNHLNNKHKCPSCVGNIKSTKEDFIKKSIEIHGDLYDYTMVEYINSKTKVKIICRKHGVFEQRPNNHFQNQKCPYCINSNIKISQEDDYSKLKYNGCGKNITIICPFHGEFEQIIDSHLLGCGCKKCSMSNGEKMIFQFLNEINIYFESEVRFSDCKNIRELKFDFYIPSKNICIEYNGLQHYKEVPFFGGEEYLIKIKKNDNIKKEYCYKNNIRLYTFTYKESNEEIKKEILLLLQIS